MRLSARRALRRCKLQGRVVVVVVVVVMPLCVGGSDKILLDEQYFEETRKALFLKGECKSANEDMFGIEKRIRRSKRLFVYLLSLKCSFRKRASLRRCRSVVVTANEAGTSSLSNSHFKLKF